MVHQHDWFCSSSAGRPGHATNHEQIISQLRLNRGGLLSIVHLQYGRPEVVHLFHYSRYFSRSKIKTSEKKSWKSDDPMHKQSRLNQRTSPHVQQTFDLLWRQCRWTLRTHIRHFIRAIAESNQCTEKTLCKKIFSNTQTYYTNEVCSRLCISNIADLKVVHTLHYSKYFSRIHDHYIR